MMNGSLRMKSVQNKWQAFLNVIICRERWFSVESYDGRNFVLKDNNYKDCILERIYKKGFLVVKGLRELWL